MHLIRTFFALPIAHQRLNGMDALLKQLGEDFKNAGLALRVTTLENLHVTLAFVGFVDKKQVAELKQILERLAPRPPIDLRFTSLGTFPDAQGATVLWAGLEPSSALSDLQAELRSKLLKEDFHLSGEPFMPHMTLGRFSRPKDVTNLLAKQGPLTLGGLRVDSVILYESFTRPNYPRYLPIISKPLSGKEQ